MKIVTITNETYQMIRARAVHEFKLTGRREGNIWHVPLSDDTWERVDRYRKPGESDDSVLQRIMNPVRH